jgi:hypothetical protein
VMLLGAKKYKKNDWRVRGDKHHLEHIRDHLDAYEKNPTLESLDDLTHAATRCMMLSQSLIENHKKEYITHVSQRGIPRPQQTNSSEFKLGA